MSKDITYKRLTSSERWANTARRLKEEAEYKCSRCGKATPRLCVHHIKPLETAKSEGEMEELCFRESNLQVLCYECHTKIHKAERYNTKAKVQERAKQRTERFFDKFIMSTKEAEEE